MYRSLGLTFLKRQFVPGTALRHVGAALGEMNQEGLLTQSRRVTLPSEGHLRVYISRKANASSGPWSLKKHEDWFMLPDSWEVTER